MLLTSADNPILETVYLFVVTTKITVNNLTC